MNRRSHTLKRERVTWGPLRQADGERASQPLCSALAPREPRPAKARMPSACGDGSVGLSRAPAVAGVVRCSSGVSRAAALGQLGRSGPMLTVSSTQPSAYTAPPNQRAKTDTSVSKEQHRWGCDQPPKQASRQTGRQEGQALELFALCADVLQGSRRLKMALTKTG